MLTLGALLALLVGAGGYFLKGRPLAVAMLALAATVPVVLGSVEAGIVSAVVLLGVLLAEPLYVILGLVTLSCFQFLAEVKPEDYGIFPEKIFELTDKNVLLAIPFFVLSGSIMSKGGIARALIDLATDLTDWIPGGLGNTAIAGCAMFAAISGSSPVTVIAIGGMMFPELCRAGFGERQAMGLLTTAGSLGIVIPPSIPMILYAIVVSGQQVIDVGELFLAGVLPGLLIGALLSVHVFVQAMRRTEDPRGDLKRFGFGLLVFNAPLLLGWGLKTLFGLGPAGALIGPGLLLGVGVFKARSRILKGFWAMMLPGLILGGIYSGVFTPTQAAAVSVVYAVVVAIYLYKELTWRDLPDLVVESTVMMGALIVIMVVAFVFNDFLVEEQIPDQAIAWLEAQDLGRISFLLALNGFLLVIGCFMDIISAILIVAPLVVPMAMAPGIDIDPIHLGIIFIVNLEVGYLTPPLGLNLFVASTLFKKPLGEVIRSVVPYTLILLVGILLVTYIPGIALGPSRYLAELRGTAQKAPPKVLSIEEIMRQAAANQGGDVDDKEEEEDVPDPDL